MCSSLGRLLTLDATAPFRGTVSGWIPREQAGFGKVAYGSIRKPQLCGVFLGCCFLGLGGSALLGAAFLAVLPLFLVFLLEHSSTGTFVLDENLDSGEVVSIVIDCSLGVVTILRSLGSVAPVDLLVLDDLTVSKCLCTSIMARRLGTDSVHTKKKLADDGPHHSLMCLLPRTCYATHMSLIGQSSSLHWFRILCSWNSPVGTHKLAIPLLEFTCWNSPVGILRGLPVGIHIQETVVNG